MASRKERWEEGKYKNEVRITVRCREDQRHAKVLRFDGQQFSLPMVRAMAEVFAGEGRAFILKPGPLSPIGKCAVCGGKLDATVEEEFHAQRSQPGDQSGEPLQ